MTNDIFISYAYQNRQYARALAEALDNTGWSVWYTDDDNPGSTVPENIRAALRNSKAILVLWSQKAASSKYVNDEVRAAIAAIRPLFFVRIDDAEIPEEFAASVHDFHEWKRLSLTDFDRSFLLKYRDPGRRICSDRSLDHRGECGTCDE